MKSKSRRLKAFTMVEMLVVMAVIALLSVLIVGGIHVAKRRANGTVCKNNLKQHGSPLASFVGDHHEYPLYLNYNLAQFPEHEPVWLRSLGKVMGLDAEGIGNQPFFSICPSAHKPKGAPSSIGYLGYGLQCERHSRLCRAARIGTRRERGCGRWKRLRASRPRRRCNLPRLHDCNRRFNSL